MSCDWLYYVIFQIEPQFSRIRFKFLSINLVTVIPVVPVTSKLVYSYDYSFGQHKEIDRNYL